MLTLSRFAHPRRARRPAARDASGLPVAEVSAHFLPPWPGKFASDCFHPSQDGYRDWARALLAVVNSTERTGRVPW
jgi:lysophospholipase L1-like esterase